MSLPIYTIDAFTDKLFSGNPAAVCLPSKQVLSDDVMQKIAAEMNLSETAFITLPADDDASSYVTGSKFGLRWFTPQTEVPICGHATLASAAVLFNCIGNTSAEIQFTTLSGVLSAKKSDKIITIYLPKCEPVQLKNGEVAGIINLIFDPSGSIKPTDIQFCPTTNYLLIRLPDNYTRKEFEGLRFKVSSMVEVTTPLPVSGLILTVRGGGGADNGSVDEKGRTYDFISRFYGPWVGIDEDPVTGSAHTVLASYWSTVLNKSHFYARQCSARGGDLHLKLDQGRVEISGASVIVLQGSINVSSNSSH